MFSAETQGKHNTLQWRTIHIGGLYHLEEEISMTTTVPNFIGEIQQFYFNNIPYIELARASRGEQSIAGFPGIRVAARFVKHATDNLHRPVTFRYLLSCSMPYFPINALTNRLDVQIQKEYKCNLSHKWLKQ